MVKLLNGINKMEPLITRAAFLTHFSPPNDSSEHENCILISFKHSARYQEENHQKLSAYKTKGAPSFRQPLPKYSPYSGERATHRRDVVDARNSESGAKGFLQSTFKWAFGVYHKDSDPPLPIQVPELYIPASSNDLGYAPALPVTIYQDMASAINFKLPMGLSEQVKHHPIIKGFCLFIYKQNPIVYPSVIFTCSWNGLASSKFKSIVAKLPHAYDFEYGNYLHLSILAEVDNIILAPSYHLQKHEFELKFATYDSTDEKFGDEFDSFGERGKSMSRTRMGNREKFKEVVRKRGFDNRDPEEVLNAILELLP